MTARYGVTVSASHRHTDDLISGDCVAVTLTAGSGAPDVVEHGRFERSDNDGVAYQHLGAIKTVNADNIRSIHRLGEPDIAAAFRVGQAVTARKHGVRYTGVVTAIRGTRLQVTVTVAPGRRRSIDVPALHASSAAAHTAA